MFYLVYEQGDELLERRRSYSRIWPKQFNDRKVGDIFTMDRSGVGWLDNPRFFLVKTYHTIVTQTSSRFNDGFGFPLQSKEVKGAPKSATNKRYTVSPRSVALQEINFVFFALFA